MVYEGTGQPFTPLSGRFAGVLREDLAPAGAIFQNLCESIYASLQPALPGAVVGVNCSAQPETKKMRCAGMALT